MCLFAGWRVPRPPDRLGTGPWSCQRARPALRGCWTRSRRRRQAAGQWPESRPHTFNCLSLGTQLAGSQAVKVNALAGAPEDPAAQGPGVSGPRQAHGPCLPARPAAVKRPAALARLPPAKRPASAASQPAGQTLHGPALPAKQRFPTHACGAPPLAGHAAVRPALPHPAGSLLGAAAAGQAGTSPRPPGAGLWFHALAAHAPGAAALRAPGSGGRLPPAAPQPAARPQHSRFSHAPRLWSARRSCWVRGYTMRRANVRGAPIFELHPGQRASPALLSPCLAAA